MATNGMSTEPKDATAPVDRAEPDEWVPGARVNLHQRWPTLLLAAALVGGSVLLARSGRYAGQGDAGFGLIDHVRPADAAAADLLTAPEAGTLAPNFLLASADGDPVRLSDLRGRPVFLNFWSTWCFFCLTEMPALQRLADEYGERVIVLGVNIGEAADVVSAYAADNGIRYPLLLDPGRAVTAAYHPRVMPTSLFIDADGVVRSVTYGVLLPPQMRDHLAAVLRE